MSEKMNKIKILKKEIEVKDRIIGKLLHVIAENKIKLDKEVLNAIQILYHNKINKAGEENNE